MASHMLVLEETVDSVESDSPAPAELGCEIASVLDEASRAVHGRALDREGYRRLVARLSRNLCRLQRAYDDLEAENQQLRGRLSRTPRTGRPQKR